MSKITSVQSGNKIIVSNRLSHPEAINERELNAIAGGMMGGLLPVVAEKKKKDIFIRCQINGLISLRTYFAGIVTKKMFLDTVINLVQLVKDCEKNLVNASNLCLNLDYIFLDPRTKSVNCIFWPIVNNHNAMHPSAFFYDLPYKLIFNKHEDNFYVAEYLRFFKSTTPFAINAFDRLVFDLAGKAIANGRLPSESMSFSSGRKEKLVLEELKNGNTGNIAYDPLRSFEDRSSIKSKPSGKAGLACVCGKINLNSARFCTFCGKKLEEVSIEARMPEKKQQNGTTLLGASSYDNGTTVLGAYDEERTPVYPFLLRVKDQDKVYVDKPNFRIGKEKQFADFFVSNNSAISRSHADIVTRDGQYFLVDHNSTNKTRVGGQVITPEKEYEIFPGTNIRFANEDFVFDI